MINDKHALNYVFSELKCSFRAMRKWRMVFLHGDWCCVELKPTLPECTAVLFCLYMFPQAQRTQMAVRPCSFTVNMRSSSVVLLQWGTCLCFRCFGLLLSPGKNVKNSDMHLLDLVGGARQTFSSRFGLTPLIRRAGRYGKIIKSRFFFFQNDWPIHDFVTTIWFRSHSLH